MTYTELREGEGDPGSRWRGADGAELGAASVCLRLLHLWRTYCRRSANVGSGGAPGTGGVIVFLKFKFSACDRIDELQMNTELMSGYS